MAKGSGKKQTVKKEDIIFVPPKPEPINIPDPKPAIAGDTADIGKGIKKGEKEN